MVGLFGARDDPVAPTMRRPDNIGPVMQFVPCQVDIVLAAFGRVLVEADHELGWNVRRNGEVLGWHGLLSLLISD